MANDLTQTVVFIPGAWMTPKSWDNFRKPFEAAGYKTHAPSWPYLEGSAAALRANPPEALGGLSVGAIVDHYHAFISSLSEQPLIIGHSFGGTLHAEFCSIAASALQELRSIRVRSAASSRGPCRWRPLFPSSCGGKAGTCPTR